MIKNFHIWMDVMRGNRPRRHFWQCLTSSNENNLTSPWARSYQRYLDNLDTSDIDS
jgi:hypothetical protein